MRDIGVNITETLKESALNSFKEGRDLEAGIILFQIIEQLLRLNIEFFSRNKGVHEEIRKRVEGEQSFFRLITYLELIHPNHGLRDDLINVNQTRNRLMHKLFHAYDSIDQVEDELREFCTDCIQLNTKLVNLMKPPVKTTNKNQNNALSGPDAA